MSNCKVLLPNIQQEIDGDPNKKQRHENIPNDYDQNSVPVPNAAKRTRERASPSFSR